MICSLVRRSKNLHHLSLVPSFLGLRSEHVSGLVVLRSHDGSPLAVFKDIVSWRRLASQQGSRQDRRDCCGNCTHSCICLSPWLGIHIEENLDKLGVGPLGKGRSWGPWTRVLLAFLQEVLIPEMKWRKVCPAPGSLPDNIPCIPRASPDPTDSCFTSRKPPGSGEFRGLVCGYCLQRPDCLSSFCVKGSL
jgi:hypothetical protein